MAMRFSRRFGVAAARFLSDGDIETSETSLIFLEGMKLPHFAAFVLLRDEAGATIDRGRGPRAGS